MCTRNNCRVTCTKWPWNILILICVVKNNNEIFHHSLYQGCESSDFNLISDLFLLFTKPHFQTFSHRCSHALLYWQLLETYMYFLYFVFLMQRYAENACTKVQTCGHMCGGIRDEAECLPCLHGCNTASSLRQDADDMCMICFTEALACAPAIQVWKIEDNVLCICLNDDDICTTDKCELCNIYIINTSFLHSCWYMLVHVCNSV